MTMQKNIFAIVPASSGPLWFAIILGIVLIGLLALGGYIVYSSRHVRFEIADQHLRIRGDLYGRSLPLSSLILDQAEVVDLTVRPELQFKWRTNGVSVPGYNSGWFRLRNRVKALAFVTDRRQVVVLPTRDGYTLLMSVVQPQEFLIKLREASMN
jgi:hypothetical protein